MYLHAGPEIGVASTKAFTCQVAAINLLMAFLNKNENFRDKVRHDLAKLPGAVKQMLDDKNFNELVIDIAKFTAKHTNALYLGRGLDFPVALEGALKLKEISYIHAEGYPAGEMKHGPIALIDDQMPCFFVVGAGAHGEKDAEKDIFFAVRSNMSEVKARKGVIITITDFDDAKVTEQSHRVVRVPYISENLAPILKILPLQLIAYHVAVLKGLDPDKPRNLAKSVTVG